ncbi:hypothetical protein A0U92_01575 [Acetobacter aceti]|uniref:Uncharacterized protein n=1 Tax=Acetobacter aceti TaxID=435 RepID=A0A1U9KD21_ACEAC|nr:hypothetical protein A0U92_01575 [Acetobacter aceti]
MQEMILPSQRILSDFFFNKKQKSATGNFIIIYRRLYERAFEAFFQVSGYFTKTEDGQLDMQ